VAAARLIYVPPVADPSHFIIFLPRIFCSKINAMKKILPAILSLLALAACNTSKITSSWQAKNAAPGKHNKIMVIGLIREADRAIRQKMEEHFVGDLKSMGYNAVSALNEYGPKAFEMLEESATLDKLKSSGVDAVLTIVLLDKEKERSYSPSWPYHGRFWGYYGRYNNRVSERDYYVVNTKYYWESNFYTMSDGQLLYSVQTQSFDPSSAESLGHEYGKMIVADMVKKNILQDSSKGQ